LTELHLLACPICHTKNSLFRQSTEMPDHTLVWYECRGCGSFLLWAGSDQWIYQKVGREDKTHLLKQVLTEAQLQALAGPAEDKPATAPKPDEPSRPTWGARVNAGWPRGAKDYPQWARPVDREKWQESGVIVWDHSTQMITRLSATRAVRILDFLRTEKAWQEEGITIGEPATELNLNDPHSKPKHVLTNQMTLDPSRVQQLLELLAKNEAQLKQMSEAEEKDRRRRLGQVYDLLLDLANRAKGKTANGGDEG